MLNLRAGGVAVHCAISPAPNKALQGCRMSDLEGAMLSDYLLLTCINHGGVADVYRALQQTGGSYEVTVKMYHTGYAQKAAFREYFMLEAEKIGQLDHPHILPLIEFGEGDALLYTVTPYITTGTLYDFLRRVGGRLSPMQALPIAQQLCDALQYAHARGIIHGNIKPSNIFIAPDGRFLLADFGFARGFEDSRESLTGIGWGSAEYVAPEQSLGVLRPASDIYTLGTILYLILTGQPPFSGQTPVEVLLKHVRQQPVLARQIVPLISEAVDQVLQKALQKRSDDRYASADELACAFAAAVQIAPVATLVAGPVMEQLPAAARAIPAGALQTPIPLLPLSPSPGDPATPPAALPEARAGVYHVEPVEWSPIAQNAPGAPVMTAREYLSQKAGIGETGAPLPPERHEGERDGKGSPIFWYRLLPVLVVLLLVLGLVGAVLSSFFFPGG